MAREFGVNLCDSLGTIIKVKDHYPSGIRFELQGGNAFYAGKYIYVNPNSHSIFDPQIGDSVLIHIECDIRGESDIIVDYEDILEVAWGEELEVKEIILRNGKHFFTPKREEA